MSRLAAFLDEADMEPAKGRPGVFVIAAAVVEIEQSILLRSFLRSPVRPEDAEPRHDFARLHVARIKDKRRTREIISTLAVLRGVTFVVGYAVGYRDGRGKDELVAVVRAAHRLDRCSVPGAEGRINAPSRGPGCAGVPGSTTSGFLWKPASTQTLRIAVGMSTESEGLRWA
ncbi:hypothetical protein IMZ11_03740 [Microtetraspora sp. AC03309]|uniref:hypothetical protein n=1 Tax=Microtetraspora sp. AC03309 TaxID=2779376 RepID=UPI001E3217B6|nr:hypothetical protein [Microtetraspora sp. AC03309]MCC5574749.1 hypothetical protein [Microtetraspora sp. AC03309]